MEALTLVALGKAEEMVQDESLASYAPKVTRDDARIDWRLDAAEVARIIRAYDPKAGAFTTRQGVDVKMFGPRVLKTAAMTGRGCPEGCCRQTADHRGMWTARSRIADVQPSGKSRMTALEWARGRGLRWETSSDADTQNKGK